MAVDQRSRSEPQAPGLRPKGSEGDLRRRSPVTSWRSRRQSFAPSTHKPLKVSFFGHFGTLNLGNECTLFAMVSRLRARYPDSEFRCICTNPEAVVASEGIEAIAITTRGRIWDREIPLPRRVPMAFVGMGAELLQYARAFRKL